MFLQTVRPRSIGDYTALIERFLTSVELVVAGTPYRITELELYVWSKSHSDPFSHRHALQREFGRWYLHRTGSGFRSGSFKGLDFTLGSPTAHVGVLIRALQRDGEVLEGPSRIVDHLLSRIGASSPAALDALLGSHPIWESRSPIFVRMVGATPATIYRTPRVGLSLKRMESFPEMPRFLAKPYRFLTDPRRTTKGRPSLAIGLHRQGLTIAEIAELTGQRRTVIEAYLAWFEEGRREKVESFAGRELNVAERCRLLGTIGS